MKKIFALIILLNFIFINLNAFAAPKFSARYDLSANDPAPSSIIFNDDGTSMYMTGRANPNVWEYSLTRGYDLTDVNALRTLNTLGEEPLPEGITFNNNGSKLYSIGSDTGSVWEYDLTTNYDLNTAISKPVTTSKSCKSI
jgi:sugar lactone lactonase YvrE